MVLMHVAHHASSSKVRKCALLVNWDSRHNNDADALGKSCQLFQGQKLCLVGQLILMHLAKRASSGRSNSMACLDRRLRLVPGTVEVAAVHLGDQGAAKLLSIPKATQAREVCSNVGDDDSQVCVQITLWVPTGVDTSGKSKCVFTGDTNQGVRSFASFEHSPLQRLQRNMPARLEDQDQR